jgi:hypothetical protein
VSPPHLKTETDPAAETLWSLVFLEHRTMDKVQKPSNSKKFPAFHGVWRFITVFTTASHYALLHVMYKHNTYIQRVDKVTAFRILILKDQEHEHFSRILRRIETTSKTYAYIYTYIYMLLYVHPLLGNVLVNKFPRRQFLVNSPLLGYTTIDEAVFSMSSAPSSGGTTRLCNPFLSNGSINTLPPKR